MLKFKFLIYLVLVGFLYAQNDTTFIEVVNLNPNIRLDIRYATENNFLGEAVYSAPRCFLRKIAATELDVIQKELEKIGLGLLIFDGYRPLSVQKKMWAILPDSRYVANPQKGSRHNRGMAVDVTLVDSKGNPLPMPTEFDSFSKKAHHDYQDLPDSIKRNRWILKNIMEKHGFKSIKTEWWHYDFKGWGNFDVLDKEFHELE